MHAIVPAVSTNRCVVCSPSCHVPAAPIGVPASAVIHRRGTQITRHPGPALRSWCGRIPAGSRLQLPQAQSNSSGSTHGASQATPPDTPPPKDSPSPPSRQEVLAAYGVVKGDKEEGAAAGSGAGAGAAEVEDYTWMPGEMDVMEPAEDDEGEGEEGEGGGAAAAGMYSTARMLGLQPRSTLPELQVRRTQAHSHQCTRVRTCLQPSKRGARAPRTHGVARPLELNCACMWRMLPQRMAACDPCLWVCARRRRTSAAPMRRRRWRGRCAAGAPCRRAT